MIISFTRQFIKSFTRMSSTVPWTSPVGKSKKLFVNNSLTKSKTEFIPKRGNLITWYSCGPTVYDASHMGHARSYITFDVIRRILSDYFGYNILFVMNITDIDDKIITRARMSHLQKEYAKKHDNLVNSQVISDVKEALDLYMKTNFPNVTSPLDIPTSDDAKVNLKRKNVISAFNALQSPPKDFFDHVGDVLDPWLDGKFGAEVTDPAIFRNLSSYWEEMYFKDMQDLNVLPPDVLTRVSEYVPEIIETTQMICKNGFGYESNGSVYFDTKQFEASGHEYAKLEPWSKGNAKLIEEGEGSLSTGTGKKSPADFALWKGSKPGEPAWDSPWGKGRPGWHIECSAMAGDVLGSNVDVHSGGIDLAFPHHDNELAQAEAAFGNHQWVNYFFHAGHLHIAGSKMSKSLKNFITIQQALESYTATQIRILFLLHSWDALLDYKQETLKRAIGMETLFNKFFTSCKSLIMEQKLHPLQFTGNHNFHQEEKELLKTFLDCQEDVDDALRDNFDTPTVLQHLSNLVSVTNVYISTKARTEGKCNVMLLERIASWITKMFGVFGVKVEKDGIGFASTSSNGAVAVNKEEVILPVVTVLSKFRDEVRSLAKQKADPSTLLSLTDKIRDDDLVQLDILLDDREDGRALIKFVDKEQILKEREEKKAKEQEKLQKKLQQQQAAEAKKLEKLNKAKINPEEMFKDMESLSLYSKWDEQGIPTHDKEGVELSKSRRKKLVSQYEAQQKLHNEYKAGKE